jgi:hypothetical protein
MHRFFRSQARFVLMGLISLVSWELRFPVHVAAEEPVEMKVIAHISSEAGSKHRLLLAAHFSIAPGWHIYAKNPGESGLPTTIRWELPAGFTPQILHWPVPVRFSNDGQPKTFGYEREVVFVAEVAMPSDFPHGEPIPITGRASWLGCSPRSCVRDSHDTSFVLKVGEVPERMRQPASFFAEWISRDPVDALSHPAIRSIEPIPGAGATVVWNEQVSEIDFLPDEPAPRRSGGSGGQTVEVHSQSNEGGKLATEVVLVSSDGGAVSPVTGSLLFRGADGSRTGVKLIIPPESGKLERFVK